MNWADVLAPHTKLAARVYAERLDELSDLAGFRVSADGTNGAGCIEDVSSYLEAVQVLFGAVAHTSAKLMVNTQMRKARRT